MAYPNLELLNYIFCEHIAKEKHKEPQLYHKVDIYVFPQTWPNTGTGFSKPGGVYGQAITTEYTVVLIDQYENMAMVCFSNTPAYIVKPITKQYMDVLYSMKMKRLYDAEKYYNELEKGEIEA